MQFLSNAPTSTMTRIQLMRMLVPLVVLGVVWLGLPAFASEEAPAVAEVPESAAFSAPETCPALEEAEIVHVDGVSGADVEMAGSGGSDNPYRTIGYALDQHSDGVLVEVHPAVYAESVTLRSGDHLLGQAGSTRPLIQGSVLISGDCTGVEQVALAAAGVQHSALILLTQGSHTTIKDNTLDGHERTPLVNGIESYYGAAITDLVIDGNTITGVHHGLYLNPGPAEGPKPSAEIIGNTISVTTSAAISIEDAGTVSIRGNVFKQNANIGVWIGAWRSDSTLRDNDFVSTGDRALAAGVAVDARQNWWNSTLGPRTRDVEPGDVPPSPMPAVTTAPAPGVSPTPSPEQERRQQQAIGEKVSGPVAVLPWCFAAGCPQAPVLLRGTVTDATSPFAAGVLKVSENLLTTDVAAADAESGSANWALVVPVDWSSSRDVALTLACKVANCGYAQQASVVNVASDTPEVTGTAFAYGRLRVAVTDRGAPSIDRSVKVLHKVLQEWVEVESGSTGTGGTWGMALAPGEYKVRVTPPGGYDPVADRVVIVEAGEEVAADVELVKRLAISGSILDQDGVPVTGEEVEVDAIGSGLPISCGVTGSTYSCSVPEGSYTVRATAVPRHQGTRAVSVTTSNVTGVDVTVTDVFVTAQVRNADGPLAGAEVTATAPGRNTVAGVTDGGGNAVLALKAGSWTIKAEADDHQDEAEGPFDLNVGDARTVALSLRPRATSTGGSGSGSGSGGSSSQGAGVPGPQSGAAPLPSVDPQPAPAPESEPEPDGAERVSGSDRNATAASLSASSFPEGASVAYIAAAGGFADALAGGPAAARQGGPVLLVDRDRLPESTRAEVERLGADRVVVLGGHGAVSPSVEAQLRSLGTEVSRVSGSDRFATAAEVSRQTFTVGVDVAYVATGGGFADALSGGAAAAHLGGPVVLVEPGKVPSVTVAELRRLKPGRIVVLGGSSAVSPAVEGELRGFAEDVRRISGPNRYATSAAITGHAFPDPVGTVYVATGENFPDALAGVPAAAKAGAPLLLVQRDDVPQPVADQLRRLHPERIVILGGEGAVSRETQRELAAYAGS